MKTKFYHHFIIVGPKNNEYKKKKNYGQPIIKTAWEVPDRPRDGPGTITEFPGEKHFRSHFNMFFARIIFHHTETSLPLFSTLGRRQGLILYRKVFK